MKSPDGAARPSWYSGVTVPRHGPLAKSTRADVCVVGAGISGLTTAYLLACEGKSVVVLDEGPVGSGQTGRTSAHLASVLDDRFVHMEKLHGVEGTRLAHQSHAVAIDTIERIAREERIACDFARLDGYLNAAPDRLKDEIDDEFAAAERAGVAHMRRLARGGLGRGPCIRFGGQGRFHPLKYLVGLAAAFRRKGGRIYTGQRVVDVQGADPQKGKLASVQLPKRVTVKADHVVVATNTPAPINDWFGIYTKQAAYRTYLIAGSIPRGALADALYWDTADPYHYVRVQRGTGRNDLVLVGGEDHKTGQFPDGHAPFAKLETWARQHVPAMGRVRFRWSGQVQEPADGMAFIGRALTAKENVYVATGDSGMGLTHGTIAGLLITDLIAGRPNAWEKIYDPSRKIMNREFVSENANALAQYKDLLTGGEVASVDEIRPGEGAVMRSGMTKLAVYRDPAGKVHRHSAICTHLQCVVQWNGVEKSWDCPCHGSRFDPLGKVLIGPAIDDLPSAK